MNDIKSVLHLYLGCEVLCDDLYIFKLVGIFPSEVERGKIIACVKNPGDAEANEFYIEEVKPILSRLSDMTEEDAKELCKLQTPEKRWDDIDVHDISHCDIHFTDGSKWFGDGVEELNDLHVHFDMLNAKQFTYLLSKGYWIFDESAFDSGIIIDKKTLQP